jgi:ERCC4-type nuclease
LAIYVDPRAGSKELLAPLVRMGVPAEDAVLLFGDLAFVSRDKHPIGIEFKSVGECISALRSGRLVGHQLPGMLGPQGIYDAAWLLVEGDWSIGTDGLMCERRRGGCVSIAGHMPASEWHKRLLTLDIKHGLHVWTTRTRAETLRWIVDTYRWYTDARLDDHDSGTTLYQRPMGIGFTAISEFRRSVATFPGVGTKWSSAVEKAFNGSLRAACNASASEWAALSQNDRCFGMKSAERVVEYLRGER